ncbi:hypothetical protein BGW80DRAFT_1176049 [Lactifluus volemus]|nr:hypothetical protein BGW80DRAFT_1176049 [Lactifluus volemus]
MLNFHKQFWGDPLPPEHLNLEDSVHDSPNDEENDNENAGKNDGDVLPESPRPPTIVSSWNQLLIRAEYLRIYNCVEQLYDEGAGIHPPAVIITGQPGIGKSYWAYYALRRRLGQKLDTLWFEASQSYLFCSEGVLIVPAGFLFTRFSSRIWTLIDSFESPDGIPITLRHGVFPIYLTSPMPDRWSKLKQAWMVYKVIMNPWTREEIKYATEKLYTGKQILEVLWRYDTLGPTARFCFELKSLQIQDLISDRDCEIADADLDLFTQHFSKKGQISYNAFSHSFYLIRRMRGSPLGSGRFTVDLITVGVGQQVLQKLEDFSIDELLGMWKTFSRFTDARGMAGPIFEAFVHRKFSMRIELVAMPMVRSNNAKSRWHALFSIKRPKTATIHGAAQEDFPLQIKVDRRFVYPTNATTKLNIEPDVYYVPQSGQQVAFDSFIFTEGYLNLFQCTAGHEHTIKNGLVDFLADCTGLPPDTTWRFVFVVPDDLDNFSCPRSKNPVVEETGLYTARISMSM